ncbi:hypothetical protein [Pseudomonas sp. OIL-1]|uniref:hypothetical protein n=1 Tax=Pseudomonas sp. OIL-1 TaxID=2706126 RepID=UPI0013A7125C|nr:hypothetical protein [Pseudomonas sp. OIL-1]QIB51704.1 hypothetical protein G3M63_11990 [Pseudomonas sp. OIL-1]
MSVPARLIFRYALLMPVLGAATLGYAQPPAVETDSPGYSAEQARLEGSQLEPDLHEEEAAIRRLYTEYSAYVEPVEKLSPDLSRNIAKGKELPAGAGRNVNPRLLAKLPDFSGYEWREAGPDLVLIRSADGVVAEVVSDVVIDEGETPAGP